MLDDIEPIDPPDSRQRLSGFLGLGTAQRGELIMATTADHHVRCLGCSDPGVTLHVGDIGDVHMCRWTWDRMHEQIDTLRYDKETAEGELADAEADHAEESDTVIHLGKALSDLKQKIRTH